jgi:hypothetical protein
VVFRGWSNFCGILLLCFGLIFTFCMIASEVHACAKPSLSDDDFTYPLSVTSGRRFLEDATGRPFFIHGDTAWSLIAELKRDEADLYLRDRKVRGFNAILVNLIEHRFAANAPANAYGDRPFLVDGDYSTPNEAYFKHADWVLRRACELGLLVLLTPSYAGNGGGPEGWYQEMVESGTQKLHGYGRFVGQRYASFKNIIWVHGGDYNPPEKDLVRAIVDGIREVDTDALHTAHGSPGSAALEYWRGEPWLSINNVYTYEPVHASSLQQYASGNMPFFLMESAYENEHDAGEYRIRMQAYQAIFSGASGHLFGNNPMWHFSGPGIYPVETTWQEALDSPGARSMTLLRDLVSSVKWWLLEPDTEGKLVAADIGNYTTRSVAAIAKDGSFALAYLPTGRGITLDLAGLSGPWIAARWFDPSNGQSAAVEGSPFRVGTTHYFVPKSSNHANLADWVLELTSQHDSSQGQ